MELKEFIDKVEQYNMTEGIKKNEISEELGIYQELKRLIEQNGDLNFLYGYTKDMEAYIFFKQLYKDDEFNINYEDGYGFYVISGNTATINIKPLGKVRVVGEYLINKVKYNPFLSNILTQLLHLLTGGNKIKDTNLFEEIINEELNKAGEDGKVECLSRFRNDAKNRVLNIKTEEIQTTYRVKEQRTTLVSKAYLNEMWRYVECLEQKFNEDIGKLRKSVNAEYMQEGVAGEWLGNINKEKDEGKIEVINKVKECKELGGCGDALLERMEQSGELKKVGLDYTYRKSKSDYRDKGVLWDNNKALMCLTTQQKMFYLDRQLATIIFEYYNLYETKIKSKQFSKGKINELCKESVIFTITRCIRNIVAHTTDYNGELIGGLYIFNMEDVKNELGYNEGLKGGIDIYFNIDRYKETLQKGIAKDILNGVFESDFSEIECRLNKQGEREILVYKDTTLSEFNRGKEQQKSLLGRLHNDEHKKIK